MTKEIVFIQLQASGRYPVKTELADELFHRRIVWDLCPFYSLFSNDRFQEIATLIAQLDTR